MGDDLFWLMKALILVKDFSMKSEFLQAYGEIEDYKSWVMLKEMEFRKLGLESAINDLILIKK
jgi:hypothetical protein